MSWPVCISNISSSPYPPLNPTPIETSNTSQKTKQSAMKAIQSHLANSVFEQFNQSSDLRRDANNSSQRRSIRQSGYDNKHKLTKEQLECLQDNEFLFLETLNETIQNYHQSIIEIKSLADGLKILVSAASKFNHLGNPDSLTDEEVKLSCEQLHFLLKKLGATYFKESYENLMLRIEDLNKKAQKEREKCLKYLDFIEHSKTHFFDAFKCSMPNYLKDMKQDLEKCLKEYLYYADEFFSLSAEATLEEFNRLDIFFWEVSNIFLDTKSFKYYLKKSDFLISQLDRLTNNFKSLNILIHSIKSLFEKHKDFHPTAINIYNMKNKELGQLAFSFEELLKKLNVSSFSELFIKINATLVEQASVFSELYETSISFLNDLKIYDLTRKSLSGSPMFLGFKINLYLECLERLSGCRNGALDKSQIEQIEYVFTMIKEEQKQRKELEDFIK